LILPVRRHRHSRSFRTPPGAIWYLPRHQTRHPGTISKSSDASLAADPPAADSLLRCQSGCYEAGAFGGRHGQSVDSGGCRLYRFLSCAETAGECRRPGQARYRPVGERPAAGVCRLDQRAGTGHERIGPAGCHYGRPPGRAAAAPELTAGASGRHSAASGQCA